MRERKQYPNLSDEELDRRAEEALRRMLVAPAPGQARNTQNTQNRRRHKKRPAK